MPISEAVMFDASIDHIKREADKVCDLSWSLAQSSIYADSWDIYMLQRSATALRHAADFLDQKRRVLEEQQTKGNTAPHATP